MNSPRSLQPDNGLWDLYVAEQHHDYALAGATYRPDPRYRIKERMTCGGMEFDIYKDDVQITKGVFATTFGDAMLEVEERAGKEGDNAQT